MHFALFILQYFTSNFNEINCVFEQPVTLIVFYVISFGLLISPLHPYTSVPYNVYDTNHEVSDTRVEIHQVENSTIYFFECHFFS